MTQEHNLTTAWLPLSATACLVQKHVGASFQYAYSLIGTDPTGDNLHIVDDNTTQYLPTPIDTETIYFRNPHVGHTSKIKVTPLGEL